MRFLDRGHYKILLHANEQGSGDAALTVHRFAELNGPDIPRLPEIKRIDAELGDFQQRSYWLEVTNRRPWRSRRRAATSRKCGSGATATGWSMPCRAWMRSSRSRASRSPSAAS